MAFITLEKLSPTKLFFLQVLFLMPVIVFYAQAIFQIGNGFSIPIFKLYQAIWVSSLLFSLYLSYKIARTKQVTSIKIISACLVLIGLYLILVNLNRPFYLIRDLLQFLADFFGFIGDLISGKVH